MKCLLIGGYIGIKPRLKLHPLPLGLEVLCLGIEQFECRYGSTYTHGCDGYACTGSSACYRLQSSSSLSASLLRLGRSATKGGRELLQLIKRHAEGAGDARSEIVGALLERAHVALRLPGCFIEPGLIAIDPYL